MQVYLGYINSFTDSPSISRDDLILKGLVNYFDPRSGDTYYIMDPYLDIINHIQTPLKLKKYNSNIWSNLISMLVSQTTTFKIITREPRQTILHNKSTPYIINYYEPEKVLIQVCKYIDTKYYGLAVHDRFIIRENSGKIRGVHIGPSLTDIKDKDISITRYDQISLTNAIKSFNDTWNECINKKGWISG